MMTGLLQTWVLRVAIQDPYLLLWCSHLIAVPNACLLPNLRLQTCRKLEGEHRIPLMSGEWHGVVDIRRVITRTETIRCEANGKLNCINCQPLSLAPPVPIYFGQGIKTAKAAKLITI